MILNEWLKNNKPNRNQIVFLWFEGDELKTTNKKNDKILQMEVMECIEEDNYKEVWLR